MPVVRYLAGDVGWDWYLLGKTSMGEGLGVHTVDYLMGHRSSIHRIQDLTFGHLVAFHVIIHGI